MKPHIQILKQERGRSVRIHRLDSGATQTVKSWRFTPWFAFKFLTGIAQPWRHLRGARRILRSSLKTPDVLSIRIGWSSPWPVVRLRMPYVDGITALEWLKSGSNALHPLASGLGVHAATLAKYGLRHRDFKLSNVVIEDGTRNIWLIDPVGVVRDSDPSRSLACMLERLNVEIEHGLAGSVDGLQSLRRLTLLSALRPLEPARRRAVLRRLRRHPRR